MSTTDYLPPIPPVYLEIPEYALPHRIAIWPQVIREDNAGGQLPWFPAARETDVPCVITHVSVEEQLLFERNGITISHNIGFAKDPLLKLGDQLRFRTSVERHRILIVQTIDNVNELNMFWSVKALEIIREGEQL